MIWRSPDAGISENQGYKVYFWSNESHEPVHFHITKGDPAADDTKVWLRKDGSMQLAHNKGKIPDKELMRILILMRSYAEDYIRIWEAHVGHSSFIE